MTSVLQVNILIKYLRQQRILTLHLTDVQSDFEFFKLNKINKRQSCFTDAK